MEIAKKSDFIELEYTGYANNSVFDSNIEEDLKKLSPKDKPRKLVAIIGEEMIVSGLDKALEGKEVGKEYSIDLTPKESFGERKKELVKTIPLEVFTNQKVNPKAGATFFLDGMFTKIVAVSGARVLTDFNNPLAGKDIKYKFKIKRIVTEEKEKIESFLIFFLRHAPKFEISDKVTIKAPNALSPLINLYKEKFKEIFKKELVFEAEEIKK